METYWKLRITTVPHELNGGGQITRPKLVQLWKIIKEHNNITHVSAGYEELNGYGEPVPGHYHWHFRMPYSTLLDPKRALGAFIRKEGRKLGMEIRGRMWCLQLVEEPDDIERFFRYPFKISPDPTLTDLPDLEEEQIALMISNAQDEQQRRVLANVKQREKIREKVTFKDKLFIYLDPNLPDFPSHQQIWIKILEYYQQENKAINYQTISGYATLYQLSHLLITPEQAYDARSKPQ